MRARTLAVLFTNVYLSPRTLEAYCRSSGNSRKLIEKRAFCGFRSRLPAGLCGSCWGHHGAVVKTVTSKDKLVE